MGESSTVHQKDAVGQGACAGVRVRSAAGGPSASPRLLRPLLLLATPCVMVRPLDEADDGPAAPHAQEVHRDEKGGQGCGEPLAEKHDRLAFVVLGDENDD